MMLASSGQMLVVLGCRDDVYRRLQAISDFSWHCPSCLFTVLPSDEVCDCEDYNLQLDICHQLDLSFNCCHILCESQFQWHSNCSS